MRRRQFLAALAASAAVPAAASRGASARTQDGFSPTSKTPVPGASEVVVGDDGTTVYAAAWDALAVVDCSDPASPTVQSRTAVTADGEALGSLQDVAVSGDRALVAGPPGGARAGQAAGAALVDVSDPANPTQVAAIPTTHAVHNVFLDGTTAYLTGTGAEGEPLLIYDVSDDSPQQLGSWSVFSENLGWDEVRNPGFYNCHDVYVQNDRAYVAYWDAGTYVLDVSDPANPSVDTHVGGIDPESVAEKSFREAIQLPGNSHYVRPTPDGEVLAIGREAFDVSDDEDRYSAPGGIAIYDTTGSEPTHVTSLKPPTVENDAGEEISATAHNFGFRGRTMYASWYSSGVRVYDLSDPANPTLLGAWADADEASFWTARPFDEGFVASSMHTPSASQAENQNYGSAELYAFPEPSGDGEPAATFETNEHGVPLEYVNNSTTTSGPTTNAPTTEVPTTQAPTTKAPTTQSPTANDEDSAPTTTSLTADDEGSTGGSVPGFGAGAAIAGGALAALHRLRGGD